jgi:hypothetical protein
MFASEFRRQIKAAPRISLGVVAALMWRAFGDGQITEAEAEELSNLIEVCRVVSPSPEAPKPPEPPKTSVGARPRTPASLERRRLWAASGRLPPALAARFTQGETAVLAVIANTVVRSGDCRHCIEQIAALAGVCRTTVKNAIRHAQALGLVSVEIRVQSAFRNKPNIVRIVSPEWQAWNRLARRFPDGGGGVKSATRSNTIGTRQGKKRGLSPPKRLPKRQSKAPEDEPDRNPSVGQLRSGQTKTT